MEAIRVLIVDDVSQVRQDLRTVLLLTAGAGTAHPIEVVGEAANGLEAICQAEALQPDAILLDLEMPVLDGYEAARQIKARYPACRIIALTIHGDEAARRRASESGVDAFIVKGASISALLAALAEDKENSDGTHHER